MKKLTICILAMILSLTFNPLTTNAQAPVPTQATHMTEAEQAKQMLGRLDEIKKLDPKHMSKAEKNNIRKEVKVIRKKLNEIGGGIYISAGALIVILILLIIFL